MRLESLDARSSVGTTSVNADALRAEYRADHALHKLTTAELQEEIDETTDVPSFDLATTMGLPISKPCPIGTPEFCCNSDDRPADCQRFGKALHKWTESLKIDRRYRQLLCFESISAPGLPKVRLFVTQSGGLLGADALQGYIGWRPVAGTPIPQHDLIFKPVALPVTILMAKRSSYNKPYIFSGKGLARLLVFIAKAKYGPFRWNMFLINDYRMSAKGRCEVFRLGDRVDLSALGGGVAAPAPGAPVPAPQSLFLKKQRKISSNVWLERPFHYQRISCGKSLSRSPMNMQAGVIVRHLISRLMTPEALPMGRAMTKSYRLRSLLRRSRRSCHRRTF